jgi:NADPH-dependent 2,4-dienoyl-CoA reductase/sulfur reductase-like enzyme
VVAGLATGESITNPDQKLIGAGIEVIHEKADGIDVAQKTVRLADGRTLPYDKLVLGTGARPVIPAIEGRDLRGVFSLRSLSDAEKIRDYIDEHQPERLVFIGAGFISLELAALLKASKPDAYHATVVEILEHPLPLMLDAEFGVELETYLKEKGLNLAMGKRVERILGSNGRVSAVELGSKERLDADMVFLNVGARPNIELAQDAGLDIGECGIRVNGFLETTNKDILAAGDCIEQRHFITGKPTPIQLRGPAVIQGRFVAKRIAGYDFEFPGLLGNSAVKIFDKNVAATGFNEDQARKEGFETASAVVESRSKHGMISGTMPWTIKLVFNRENQRLIGGQILSDAEAPVKEIDAVNALIWGHKTVQDLTMIMCAGNPDCSSEPSLEPISIAAEQALQKMKT